jgi:hypothetical protein
MKCMRMKGFPEGGGTIGVATGWVGGVLAG